MSEDRRSRSRSRSRSPERGNEDNTNAADDNNNAPPPAEENGGAPVDGDANNAPPEDEGVKLYVGNLDYCECSLLMPVLGVVFAIMLTDFSFIIYDGFYMILAHTFHILFFISLQQPLMNPSSVKPSENSATSKMSSSPWTVSPPAPVALALSPLTTVRQPRRQFPKWIKVYWTAGPFV